MIPDGQAQLRFGPPKTQRSLRTIRIPRHIAESLKKHCVNRLESKFGMVKGYHDMDLVFPCEKGTPFVPENIKISGYTICDIRMGWKKSWKKETGT